MSSNLAVENRPVRQHLWLERILAIAALINLGLVFFNLSYLAARDFYFQVMPGLVRLYDPVKGLVPHPETRAYLDRVSEFEVQASQGEWQSERTEVLLQELRSLSQRAIEDNPFAPHKTSALEKIKTLMRDRTGQVFARDAFATFWSQAYLSEAGWEGELNFFNAQIRPFIEKNYYQKIGQYGQFADYFWIIDLPFIVLFAFDFLVRTFSLSRRKTEMSWRKAMLRRWYDIFLFLPFWRWLRVIPTAARLYQSNLVNLEPIRKQINYDFAANFAEELTEMVGIQTIDQMQESIQRGELARWLFHPETRRPYIQVNATNEVKAIASRIVHLSICKVMPKVQPNIQALLQHSLQSSLDSSPIYRQLEKVPILSHLPEQMTEELAKNMSQAVRSSLVNALEDPVGAELTGALLKNFRDALEEELQKTRNLEEIESWLVDLLEEIKINYVRRIAEGGFEKALHEAERLHQIIYEK